MAKFKLDSAARFIRPEILQHPHIPGDLAGINPRTIMGRVWWNEVRKKAYGENNGHCWACGGLSAEDKYHPWLEAHEFYAFDYPTGIMEFQKIVALDHSCHNFIHSGRLWMLYRQGTITRGKLTHILQSRLSILKAHKLKPFIYTKMIVYMLRGDSELKARGKAWVKDRLPWPRGPKYPHKWKMVFDGNAYCKGGKVESWTSTIIKDKLPKQQPECPIV